MSSTVDTLSDLAATVSATTSPPMTRWRRPLLALVAIETVVLFAPTVSWLVDRWTMSVWHNAHGIFVLPLAAWLAYQELKDQPDLPVGASGWGFALLIPALLLHAIDAGLHTQLLSAVALFLTVPGICLLVVGWRRTRAIGFPLLFLWFALPIPLAFTEPLQMLMRSIAAGATANVLPLIGVSVFREGTTLHTVTGIVEVSDACSGFSTLYAALTVAALVTHSTRTWRRAIVVAMAAAPLAILANILRVIALTLIVTAGHAELLDTFIHPLSGMLTFALALPVLFWLGEPGRSMRP